MRAIVNVAVGDSYIRKSESMRWHCRKYCACDADLLFTDGLPSGCPTHADRQYAFKIFALREAVAKGYRNLLWIDVSFMPQWPITQLWETIERDGWYVPAQGTNWLGSWCSDDALRLMSIGREAAFRAPLVYSGLVGLSLDHAIGAEIWRRWQDLYERGVFDGPHRNDPGVPRYEWGDKWAGHCSDDLRVEGHRHDESALSAILFEMGLVPHGDELVGPGRMIEMHRWQHAN